MRLKIIVTSSEAKRIIPRVKIKKSIKNDEKSSGNFFRSFSFRAKKKAQSIGNKNEIKKIKTKGINRSRCNSASPQRKKKTTNYILTSFFFHFQFIFQHPLFFFFLFCLLVNCTFGVLY